VVVIAASLAMLFLQWRGIADLFEALRAGARPASTGLARIGPGGVAVAMTAFALEVLLLSRIREPASRTAALVILGLRFLFSRRFGGVPGFALAGASAIIEVAVIMTIATLSSSTKQHLGFLR